MGAAIAFGEKIIDGMNNSTVSIKDSWVCTIVDR